MGFAMMGSMFLLIIFMVNVLGYSEVKAAIAVTPLPALGALLSPLSGKLIDHVSPRVPVAVGMVFMGTGLLLLRGLGADATLWDVSWRTLLLGAGMGFAMPPLAAAGMSAVPHSAGGVGSGVINWSRQMGFVLGVALLVAIFSSSMTTQMNDAVTQAKALVSSQTQMPAAARAGVLQSTERSVATASATPGRASTTVDLLGGVPQAPAGSPDAVRQQQLKAQLAGVFHDSTHRCV